MEKNSFSITRNRAVARDTFRMSLKADGVALPAVRPGQFAEVELPGRFLRRPFAVADMSEDSIDILYKVVGEGTQQMSRMEEGRRLDILTGLGNGFNLSACRKSAVLAGGGLGAAPLLMLCKALRALGREVSVALGFNTASEVILADEFKALGADVSICTMDGSAGIKGFVTDAIARSAPDFDIFYTCGPLPMMKAVCSALPVHGQVSLEARMGCGFGICYGCTVETARGPRRVCSDGPVFDKEDMIWK